MSRIGSKSHPAAVRAGVWTALFHRDSVGRPKGEDPIVALPGLRRLDHVGFTVPDLDEATRFLTEVLGCEYLYSLGPFRSDDEWMTEHLNVHRRAVVTENRFFRCGDQAVFEVFHYTSPDPRTELPRNSDVGGHHVALYVDDLDAAIEHLRVAGVEVLAGPRQAR